MDWLTFFSNMIGSLAWPVVAVILVLLFKKPILDRLPLLLRLKYKDLEVEFEKKLEEVQAEVRTKLVEKPAPKLAAPEKDELAALIGVSPKGAILLAFQEVERALEDAATRLGATPNAGPAIAVRLLREKKAIDESLTSAIYKLRDLRNQASHARDFDPDEATALDYATTARAIMQFLNNVGR